MNKDDKKESNVHGIGYGDQHIWYEKLFHPNEVHLLRFTTWKCRRCFCVFNHMYNYIPNIFECMKACHVPELCTRKFPERLLKLQVTGIRLEDRT